MIKKRKIKKTDQKFVNDLYRKYSPELSKRELEDLLKNFQYKDMYEKKILISHLNYLKSKYVVDNGDVSYLGLFGVLLATLLVSGSESIALSELYDFCEGIEAEETKNICKAIISDELTNKFIYIALITFFIIILFGLGFNNRKHMVSKIEYLLVLLKDI